MKKFDVIGLIDNLISDRPYFKEQLISFFRSPDFKWILYSSILGAFLLLFGFYVIWSYGAQLSFIGQASNSVVGFKSNFNDPNYITDRWFYFKNFLNIDISVTVDI